MTACRIDQRNSKQGVRYRSWVRNRSEKPDCPLHTLEVVIAQTLRTGAISQDSQNISCLGSFLHDQVQWRSLTPLFITGTCGTDFLNAYLNLRHIGSNVVLKSTKASGIFSVHLRMPARKRPWLRSFGPSLPIFYQGSLIQRVPVTSVGSDRSIYTLLPSLRHFL